MKRSVKSCQSVEERERRETSEENSHHDLTQTNGVDLDVRRAARAESEKGISNRESKSDVLHPAVEHETESRVSRARVNRKESRTRGTRWLTTQTKRL